MKLILDYRESDLISAINSISQSKPNKFEITTENLIIGDIVIKGDDNADLVIIERKTLQDLAASIRDGRYNEQSFRLDECEVPNHNIIYLIEGKWVDFSKTSRFNKSITEDILLSSMVSINYFKGFSLFRTQTIEESAKFILKFIEKIQKETGKRHAYYRQQVLVKREEKTNISVEKTSNILVEPEEVIGPKSKISVEITDSSDDDDNEAEAEAEVLPETTPHKPNYLHSIKKTKKEHITISNIGEIVLSQIPNVSMQGAIAIMSKFKTITNLIKNLESDTRCLDDVVTTSSGKPRRLNKVCVNNVFKFMLQRENEI